MGIYFLIKKTDFEGMTSPNQNMTLNRSTVKNIRNIRVITLEEEDHYIFESNQSIYINSPLETYQSYTKSEIIKIIEES